MPTYSAWVRHWKGLGCSDREAFLAAQVCTPRNRVEELVRNSLSFNPSLGRFVLQPWVEIVSRDAVRRFNELGQFQGEVRSPHLGTITALRARMTRMFGAYPGRIVDVRDGKRLDL